MVFKKVQLTYLVCIGLIYCVLITIPGISERFDKGIIIKEARLKKLLWMRKTDEYISYVSIAFCIIGYFELIATVISFVVSMFVSYTVAEYIVYITFGVCWFTFIIQHAFLPPYGNHF